jgi:aminoglycoside phosphotransferase (APT) family kinase protein
MAPVRTAPHLRQPPAEVDITVEMVRALLRAQHPDLPDASLQPVAEGWDNAVFRLGPHLAVRLPRRLAAVELLVKEQTWLPQLAPRLPLPVPTPVRVGLPGEGYPWRWSVVPWISGAPADICSADSDQGATLAAFFNALHVPAPDNAPLNDWRGVALSDRRAVVEQRMHRLGTDMDATIGRVEEIWIRALEAPLDAPSTWLHGDLHSQNVLVDGGKLSGIIDWGDLCRGDRATDLAAIWMLLGDIAARETAIRLCPDVSEATWNRARGWAIFFGVLLSDMEPAGNERHGAAGKLTLRRVVEGP